METTPVSPAVESISGVQVAPYASRTVRIGARTKVSLLEAGHPLASFRPKTKVGALALDLAVAATASYLTVMATAGYVYAVTQLQLPNPTFGTPPGGVNINPADLQNAWTQFNTNYALIQGQLDGFMDTTPGTSNPTSILSQLVNVPQTIQRLSGTITLDFAAQNASDLEMLFNAFQSQVKDLNTSLTTLGTNIANSTSTLTTAANTGVLAQLYAAYESDIQGLQQAIDNAQNTIDSDNKKIVGEGFGAGVSIVVGLIGLANFWNPIGWIMMAGGAVGAYYAIEEIESLKAQIAGLKNTIQTDTDWENTYSQAATAMQATIGSIQGFSSMQAAAEQELTALENVLTSIYNDLVTAVNELEQSTPDWTDAQNEWNTVMSVAGNLANVTAYIWPNPQLLSSPTGISSTSSGLYQVASSGIVSYLVKGGSAWTSVPDRALSVVTGSGGTVVGINGAPALGAAGNNPNYTTDYFVRTYDPNAGAWTAISTFPAAQVATDGTNIFAINQTVTSRQVMQYGGSGTNWNGLPALPNSDAAESIAVANGTVYALSLNGQQVYYYANSQWNLLSSTLKFIGMSGNGNYLGLVDTGNNCYLWNAQSNQFANSGNPTATNVLTVGQSSDGSQFMIDNNQNLNWINNAGAPVITQLAPNVVGFTTAGDVYRFDADGNGYYLANLSNNSWTALPAIS